MEQEIVFKKLAQKYNSPQKVQKLLKTFKYNHRHSMNSALTVWKTKNAHCYEAVFFAAAILEHQGYPPLIVSIESWDGLDHVLFVFKKNGKWGAVARSRDQGLHGRPPIFKTIKALVLSYMTEYVDKTGRITGFAQTNLDFTNSNWRYSKKNVWKAEKFLINLKHRKLKMPENKFLKAKAYYLAHGGHPKKSYWW